MSDHITPDTVAPLPERVDDTTADQYARYATARAARGIGYLHEAAAGPLTDRYFRYANAVGGDYAVAFLVRALIEHAPEAADEVVRSLREHVADGDSVAELTWEWATEYGIDAGALANTGAAKAKETTRTQPTAVDTLASAVEAAVIHKFTLGTSLGEHHAAYHRFAVSIAKKVMEIVAPVLDAESARSYSQGVEDMRTAAMRAASDAPGTPYTPVEAIRDAQVSRHAASDTN